MTRGKGMWRRNAAAVLGAAALIASLAGAPAHSQTPGVRSQSAAAPGQSDAARSQTPATRSQPTARPDFSGVWLPDGRRNAGQWPKQPPFTDAMKQAREAWAQKAMPINFEIDDENTSCIPGTMPGIMMGIAQYPFEVINTPSQIVILTEIYGLVRRIHLDGRPAPPELLPTRMGFSVGRWEGDVLVVETTHVLPQNERATRPTSGVMRIVERFSLQHGGPYGKELIDEITVHDAATYTQPITVRMYYKWAPDVSVGEYLCQQDIWDQHMDGHRSEIPWRK